MARGEFTYEDLRRGVPLKRGYFLVRLDADKEFIIPFLFNPRPIKEREQAKYSTIEIPGYADPALQYVSGDALTITFTIILEQGRLDEVLSPIAQRRYEDVQLFSTTKNSLSGGTEKFPNTVDEYVELYRGLLSPRSPFTTGGGGNTATRTGIPKSPPRIVFFFGLQATMSRMTRLAINKEEYRADMTLDYVELDVTLQRDDPLNKRASSITTLSSGVLQLPHGVSTNDLLDATAHRPAVGDYRFN